VTDDLDEAIGVISLEQFQPVALPSALQLECFFASSPYAAKFWQLGSVFPEFSNSDFSFLDSLRRFRAFSCRCRFKPFWGLALSTP